MRFDASTPSSSAFSFQAASPAPGPAAEQEATAPHKMGFKLRNPLYSSAGPATSSLSSPALSNDGDMNSFTGTGAAFVPLTSSTQGNNHNTGNAGFSNLTGGNYISPYPPVAAAAVDDNPQAQGNTRRNRPRRHNQPKKMLTVAERDYLREQFVLSHYPDKDQKAAISAHLGLEHWRIDVSHTALLFLSILV